MEFSEEELEEVLNIFLEESEEQIQKLNENFLQLEANPSDDKAIQEIFREAHSLKGAARMIGLDEIQTIAHKLEDIFGLARKGELVIKPEVIDVMCNAVDAIATIINETVKAKGTTSIDVDAVVCQLKIVENSSMFTTMEAPVEEEKVEKLEEKEEQIPFQTVTMAKLAKQEPDIVAPPTVIKDESFSEDELEELKKIFLAESQNLLSSMLEGLDKLKQFPYDKEVLTDVYRLSHTLEGSVRIVDFEALQAISHHIRDIFEQAVKEEIFINSDILLGLERNITQVKEILEEEYKKSGYGEPLNLEDLEKQITAKMESYKKKVEKPKKVPKSKISLSSSALNIDEKEVLREFGVLNDEDQEKSKVRQEKHKKQLEVDPLSLSDDELGELEIGSLKGVKPLLEIPQCIDESIVAITPPELRTSESEMDTYRQISAEKSREIAFGKEDLESLFDILIEDFNKLSNMSFDKDAISRTLKSNEKVKNLLVKQNKQELLAIIAKIETLLFESFEDKMLLNKDMIQVIIQSLESIKPIAIMSGQEFDDIVEDPSLIYQRLVILHQTVKLSAGLPYIEEIEPEIFQTKEQIEIAEPVIQPKMEAPEKDQPKVSSPSKSASKPEEPPVEKKEASSEKNAAVAKTPPPPMFMPKQSVSPTGEMSPPKEAGAESLETYTIKTLRVDTRKLDQLVGQVGELIIAKIKAKERLLDIEKLLNLVEDWQRDWSKMKYAVKNMDRRPQKSAFMAEGTSIYTPGKDWHTIIRDNSDTLAQLTNQLNLLYHNIQEDDARLTLIINELEERIKNVRLLPLTTIFNMFPRMVRDIAREQKKDMELEIYGSETTVDKKIIEEIKSPLMHIIRNAIDHGIEKPEDREKNGKARTGKIVLSARHLENSVLIEIIDDGRGINIEAIKKKVLEKELLSISELAAMSETQIMNIIFWPGFSTGSEITDISGRGVGMDVVHTKITQLNGKVKVDSKIGEGCRVAIQLPVTMATIQVFLVKILNQTYAIPTSAIKSAVLVKPESIFYKEGRQSVLVGGLPVFLCNLAELLELPAAPGEKHKKDKLTVIVLQNEEVNIGFIVDGLLGDQEILHKNFEPPLIRVRNVAGVTTLGSGEVCLILNVGDLVKTAQMTYGMALRPAYQVKDAPSRKRDVLVVDDSVTTRILERNILRAAGYNVTVAVNGLDALTKLTTQHFDLVVSDVEMPDISGFELVSRIKKDSILSKIPVVLVTSLASEVDRQKGLSSGASAYITKGGFDQEELLSTIRRLII